MAVSGQPSNFAHLRVHDEQLVRLGQLAERYFVEDPNTCLLKLRQLTELLAQLVASNVGLFTTPEEKQADLLRRLQDQGIVPREVGNLFHEVRRAGNDANHKLAGDHRSGLLGLRLTWQLGVWFHRTFKDPAFKSGPFQPPSSPADEGAELKAELDNLRAELAQYRATHQDKSQELDQVHAQVKQAEDERAFWESMAAEAEAAKAELLQRLQALQAKAETAPPQTIAKFVTAANSAAAAIQISESDTRKLIDEQLVAAGWTVNSAELTFAKGARPQRGQHLAIAEWPTETGPADYALFVGLTPVAIVEAKRKHIDVSAALQQAKRYSRGFRPSPEVELPATNYGAQAEFRIPFVFSSNGRPYLRQLAQQSGVWFCDLRRPENLGHALDGWYTPDGLSALLQRDEARAHIELDNAPFDYGFPLRPYQERAIRATEASIQEGQRAILLAMATGTGKTKTCIALIYRLLKAKRFRRILFLVDRSALGEQAANAFKDTRMERLQTFADIFGIKELDEQQPDADTAVHLATVQGMVQRVICPADDQAPPPIDQYDCIVVDECHRGYLLDRELSDTELSFRGYDDYVSKYRRVLDYFDAVKVGLTATPALHTTQIFGAPVFTYGYREAVVDGYLVDYEPPIQVHTLLSGQGIAWKAGEEVKVYNTGRQQIELFKTPDEIKLKVDDFNRKVITRPFNEVVCTYLAQELDPASRRKTLIFCVSDSHADMVVDLLKKAFAAQYGAVEDDAVIKITGAADKPLQLIRRYKNERLPNVAVTVDLLTTGVDVPEICNLVFLRQVNSRILFDQMLGRATRLCDFGGTDVKDSFRVFDAVRIFEAIGDMTAMKPVVVNPKITFTQLAQELATLKDESATELARDQFLAKLQAKKRHLTDKSRQDFEAKAGMPVQAFVQRLKAMPLADVAAWFVQNPELGELLDRRSDGPEREMFVSEHADAVDRAERGYGKGKKRPKKSEPPVEQPGTRWDDLLDASAPERLDTYKEMLLDYGLHGRGAVQEIYANANTFITKPATLSKLVTDIDSLDWYSVDRDDLGNLYENLLERNAGEKKSGAGQYFTPRHLIDSIVSVMKPQLSDVIQDPAAGTCGFLIAANNYLRQHNDFDSLSDKAQRKYRHQTFFGMELVQDTHRLALMNMLLHDIEGGVTYGDTLSDDHKQLPPATLVLSNPPFGTKKGGGLPTRGDLTFETSNKQFAFLQHIYRALKPGGRAAVVLPDNVLFESNIGAEIRRDLMDKCNLHTILRLPTGIFYAQGVKTNVLFFTRGEADKGNTKEVWVYDMRANMPAFGKRTPFTRDYFLTPPDAPASQPRDKIEDVFGSDPRGGPAALAARQDTGEAGRWRRFTREQITQRGDNLDIAWLKDNSAATTQQESENPARVSNTYRRLTRPSCTSTSGR